jgi:hypothetical protein
MQLQDFYSGPMPSFWGPGIGILFLVLLVWTFVWKAMALWKSARIGSKPWFIVLLIVNTVGILDILYLYVFSKKSAPAQGSTTPSM